MPMMRASGQRPHSIYPRLSPAEVPHGLWWLCPMEDPKQTPSLDGRTVEVVDRATEWAVLDSLFLKELRTADREGQ